MEATVLAQKYLDRLEFWMNLLRLSLAPHKCAQVTFSKAANVSTEGLDLELYSVKIPFDPNPKFLGIIFDKNLSP